MNTKLFSVLALVCVICFITSCKKEDASASENLTATVYLDASCPSGDSVTVKLFEVGNSTTQLIRQGVAGKIIDFGKVNPGSYYFQAFDIQPGSPCNYYSSMTYKLYYSDNFQLVEGEGRHIEVR